MTHSHTSLGPNDFKLDVDHTFANLIFIALGLFLPLGLSPLALGLSLARPAAATARS